MPSKKHRRKDRKNTYKLIDDAFDALESGHEALADRLAKRALDKGAMNPRIWCDRARILDQLGQRGEAERAYRNAVSLAPTYVDALASLARLLASAGRFHEARGVQRRVVELSPEDAAAAALLAAYDAEAPEAEVWDTAPPETDASAAPPAARAAHIDWAAVDGELARCGAALLPGLLDARECQSLRELWNEPERFEHEIVLDDARGKLAYRFFKRPLPPLVRELREEVYARAAPIVNRWNALLGKADRYPASLSVFMEQCRRAGQARTTPILLRYPEGGFNAFHRDVHGDIVFPLQLAVTLGPEGGERGGGDLLLVDERPGRLRVRAFCTDVGEGALFCARERLVRIGGLHGLQPVRHAVDVVTAKERYAVGIPFHEYA